MPDLENLLREELQHEAQKVQPELLRPLQVPTRRPSWRPRLLPFTAAAAVIAVITAGALVAGLKDLMKVIPKEKWILFSHQLIWHGRRVCVARKPRCLECNLESICYSKDKTV